MWTRGQRLSDVIQVFLLRKVFYHGDVGKGGGGGLLRDLEVRVLTEREGN